MPTLVNRKKLNELIKQQCWDFDFKSDFGVLTILLERAKGVWFSLQIVDHYVGLIRFEEFAIVNDQYVSEQMYDEQEINLVMLESIVQPYLARAYDWRAEFEPENKIIPFVTIAA